MHVNLLPIPLQRRALIRQRIRQWSTICCLCALPSVLDGSCSYVELLQQNRQLQQLAQECSSIWAIDARTRELLAKEEALEQAWSERNTLEQRRDLLSVIGMVGQSVAATGGRVRVEQLGLSRLSEGAGAANSGTRPGHPGAANHSAPVMQLVLQGSANDDVALTKFVDRLRAFPIFGRVDLKSVSAARSNEAAERSFRVETRFAWESPS